MPLLLGAVPLRVPTRMWTSEWDEEGTDEAGLREREECGVKLMYVYRCGSAGSHSWVPKALRHCECECSVHSQLPFGEELKQEEIVAPRLCATELLS